LKIPENERFLRGKKPQGFTRGPLKPHKGGGKRAGFSPKNIPGEIFPPEKTIHGCWAPPTKKRGGFITKGPFGGPPKGGARTYFCGQKQIVGASGGGPTLIIEGGGFFSHKGGFLKNTAPRSFL